MNRMKTTPLIVILLSVLLMSCNDNKESKLEEKTPKTFKNKGQELVSTMVNEVGDYQTLLDKKDVVYTYTYTTADGKSDISTEKYIFDGELSYGLYEHHERTFPDLEGQIEQGFDGDEYWLKHNRELVQDEDRLKKVAFNRPTNFYWFAMFQKLLDPSVNYEFVKEETIKETEYDIVKITFNSDDDQPTDIYQLYINKETSMVDQFLFTVADFGVIETPYLMILDYDEIDGMLIPAKRRYKKSTWDAAITEGPWTTVNWTNIQFNNDLSKEVFEK